MLNSERNIMGIRAKKPCNKIGCHNLVEYPRVYCTDHKEYEDRLKHFKNKRYDNSRKDDKEFKFYRTKAWKKFREYILSRDNDLCQECLKEDKITRGNLVHHIVPIREDYEKRLDFENCITVCNDCHEKIHNRAIKSK